MMETPAGDSRSGGAALTGPLLIVHTVRMASRPRDASSVRMPSPGHRLLALAFMGLLASPARAACGDSMPVRHALDSFWTGLPEATLVGFAYALGDAKVQTGQAPILCRFSGEEASAGPCPPQAGSGSDGVVAVSGNWADPTPGKDGHGFQFEILPDNGILAIWFVFTPDGTGQTWLYSQGTYDPTSNTVTLPVYVSTGPKFPPEYNVSDRHLTQGGTLTFTFTYFSHGTVSWTSTAQGYPASCSFLIARVTSLAGLSCP